MNDLQIKEAELKFIQVEDQQISYQVFGRDLHEAPLILVHHALTGNSDVAGKNGWWKELVGYDKVVDLNRYCVLCFNIPGNGYSIENQLDACDLLNTRAVAKIFWQALFALEVFHVHAMIGGSLGGGIAWEMAFLDSEKVTHLIPIATDWKASDWLIAQVFIQEQILKHAENPLKIARMHAMTLYRSAESFDEKFQKSYDNEIQEYAVESWLNHHGETLKNRFSLSAYLRMNHLLGSIGEELSISEIEDFAKNSSTHIHWISIDSDLLFPLKQQLQHFEELKKDKENMNFYRIQSPHGHDAFLIEYAQLNQLLQQILNEN